MQLRQFSCMIEAYEAQAQAQAQAGKLLEVMP